MTIMLDFIAFLKIKSPKDRIKFLQKKDELQHALRNVIHASNPAATEMEVRKRLDELAHTKSFPRNRFFVEDQEVASNLWHHLERTQSRIEHDKEWVRDILRKSSKPIASLPKHAQKPIIRPK